MKLRETENKNEYTVKIRTSNEAQRARLSRLAFMLLVLNLNIYPRYGRHHDCDAGWFTAETALLTYSVVATLWECHLWREAKGKGNTACDLGTWHKMSLSYRGDRMSHYIAFNYTHTSNKYVHIFLQIIWYYCS